MVRRMFLFLAGCHSTPDLCPELCRATVRQPERVAASTDPWAHDVWGGRLGVPMLDGVDVRDLTRPDAPVVASWVHPELLYPIEVRFVGDDEVAVRTADQVLWAAGSVEMTLAGAVALDPMIEPDWPFRIRDQLLSTASLAVVVGGHGGLTVIDRSPEAGPTVAASQALGPGIVWGACLQDQTLVTLVSDDDTSPEGWSEVQVWSLSDPSEPEMVQTFDITRLSGPYSLSCDADRVVATAPRRLLSLRWDAGELRLAVGHDVIPPGKSSSDPRYPSAISARVSGDRALVELRPRGEAARLHILDLAALESGTDWDRALGEPFDDELNRFAVLGEDPGVVYVAGEVTAEARPTLRYDWSGEVVQRGDGGTLPPEPTPIVGIGLFEDIAVAGDGTAFSVRCAAAPVPLPAHASWTGLASGIPVDDGALVQRDGAIELLAVSADGAETLDTLPGGQLRSAWGTRFVLLDDEGHVHLGSISRRRMDVVDVGCLPTDGGSGFGDHEACGFVIDAAITRRHLAVLTPEAVHVYRDEDGEIMWTQSIDRSGRGLESGRRWVALVQDDEVVPIDTVEGTVGDAWPLAHPAGRPVRVDEGVLFIADDPMQRVDLAQGRSLPGIDLPTVPAAFQVSGDLVVASALGVLLTTVDPICEAGP